MAVNTARMALRRPALPLLLSFLILLTMAGCGVDLANPPRLSAAQTPAAPAVTDEMLVLAAPTATPSAAGAPSVGDAPQTLAGTDLTVWVNESSPEHEALMQSLAAEFSQQTGANVAVQLVAPAVLPELVNTAVLSGTLPDLVVHPLEYTAGWAERGILDASAAAEVVAAVGADRFDPDALAAVAADGADAAVPLHGFHQLLLYRTDWLAERGLAVPDDYAAILAAAEATFNREQLVSGIVVPTESNLVTTHQAFEQLALANGCELIDEQGEVRLLDDACRRALESYYRTINQFSPSGVQTDTSALNAYLAGQTAIIMSAPSILPALAGLNPDHRPTCPECSGDDVGYLADNTGIVTALSGDNPNGAPVAFGNLTNLGITATADREAAVALATFWLEQGYEQWLAVEPERKVPMLWGTAEEPRRYIDAWGTTPLPGSDTSLADLFGDETVAQLRDGIAAAPRWGIRHGHGALMTSLYEDLTLSIVLQEMLSGYFNVATSAREAFRRVVDQIPNYAFSTELPPDPTPEPTATP